MQITLPAWAVLRADGKRRALFAGMKVQAGPTKCRVHIPSFRPNILGKLKALRNAAMQKRQFPRLVTEDEARAMGYSGMSMPDGTMKRFE